MSPNVRVRPMVDRENSPAFRAMDLVRENFFDVTSNPETPVFELIIHRILRLYESMKSSLWDIDVRGQSILHLWGHVSSWTPCKSF